jgi:excisionase family DNA binding protein
MPERPGSPDLLSLSEAAALLGVHPATLRRWADQGDVLVMVTPGGHRRFPRTEIERLTGVEAHAGDEEELAGHLVERALARTRERLPEQAGAGWVAGFDAGERREKRETGRRLMALLRDSLAAEDGEQAAILEGVRAIGRRYADDARAHGIGLTDVLRAVTFFRDQTVETTLTDAGTTDRQASRRFIQRVNAFFNAVLLAVAAAFD